MITRASHHELGGRAPARGAMMDLKKPMKSVMEMAKRGMDWPIDFKPSRRSLDPDYRQLELDFKLKKVFGMEYQKVSGMACQKEMISTDMRSSHRDGM